MMAALGGNKPRIIVFNLLLSLIVIPLTYALGRRFKLAAPLVVLAALLVAHDTASIKYAGSLRAEPLANLFLALAVHAAGSGRDRQPARYMSLPLC